MYTVYSDGSLVYAPNVPELKITDPKLHLKAGMAGSFDFTIYPSHPLYAQIKRLTSIVEVLQEDPPINGNGGRNLWLKSNTFDSSTLSVRSELGVKATFAPGISVPEWGATDATRIQTTGGTESIKVYKFFIAMPPKGTHFVLSLWIKNQAEKRMQILPNEPIINGGSGWVEPGESKRLVLAIEASGRSNFQCMFSTESVGDELDIVVWRGKAEKGNKPTDWTPAPEDGATGRKVRLFRGRVLNDKIGFRNERMITCEGELAYFNDSIYRPYSYAGSVKGFLQAIIDSHNAQVEPKKQFAMGDVTVTDPNDYIVRSSINADKSWNVMQDKLVKMLGGYFMIRRVEGINCLDYLADSDRKSNQVIRLGENLLDLQKEIHGEDIVTALIPYGAKLEDTEGNEIDERVTIEPVNDGIDYVYDADAVDLYGWVFDTQQWDDVTQPQNLLTKARQELAQRILMGVSLEIQAVDLSMTDREIDDLRVFEYVKVDSPVHLLDDYMLVTKLDIDLFNPQNNTLSLGLDYKTFTDQQRQTDSAIKDIQILTPGEIRQELSNAVTQATTVLQSSIEQTDSAIRLDVSDTYSTKSDLEDYSRSVATQFEQTSDAFDFNFNTLTEKITNLGGDTQTQFEDIQKYIRFVDGDIVLGQVDNPFVLEIRNDRISFLQDGVEVAYLSNEGDTQKLYINDGEIIRSLKIGNFAFTPRENGNLSFKKVT